MLEYWEVEIVLGYKLKHKAKGSRSKDKGTSP